MRYPVKSWTADAARAHCKGKKGTFEAAKKSKEKSEMEDELRYRSIEIRAAGSGAPSTFDREKRTVDVTLSTEEPVVVWGEREVLLAEGAQIPKNKKIPMLDAHNRFTFDGILGSFKDIRKSNGEVLARAHFSKREKAEDAFTLIEEGHLTDVSVGYKVNKYVRIADKETQMIKGREFKGPMVVVTDWTLREGSVAPVGADINAKVRASERENQGREDDQMDEKFRQYLISRGLPEDATEDEANKFLGRLEAEDKKRIESTPPASQPADPPKDKDIDPEKVREEGILAERARVAEITGLGQRLGNAKLAQDCIDEGISVENAMRRFVDWKSTQEQETVRTGVAMDERDKFRAAALDSVLLRSNVEVEDPAPGAEDLRGFTLKELARESLRVAGLKTSGQPMDMIGRAMMTSDFPLILADSARKSLFIGFDTAPESWSIWCGTGNVSDFKTHSSVRASEYDDLLEVPEHGEFIHGVRSEAQEQYYIATYGRLFAITRQTIINDDLNALSDVPRGHGEAAARKLGDIAYAVLTANAAMGDGTNLFDAAHGNVGTGGVPSETTIGEAVKLAALQKDIAGKRKLNIRLEYFLGPVTIQTATEIFFESELYSGADATSFRKNIFAGKFTRIYESRLDDDDITKWYMAGAKGKTVTMFFLNGIQTPYLESKQGWTVDGVEYKVRIDAGAKAMDWRALVYNAGE